MNQIKQLLTIIFMIKINVKNLNNIVTGNIGNEVTISTIKYNNSVENKIIRK